MNSIARQPSFAARCCDSLRCLCKEPCGSFEVAASPAAWAPKHAHVHWRAASSNGQNVSPGSLAVTPLVRFAGQVR